MNLTIGYIESIKKVIYELENIRQTHKEWEKIITPIINEFNNCIIRDTTVPFGTWRKYTTVVTTSALPYVFKKHILSNAIILNFIIKIKSVKLIFTSFSNNEYSRDIYDEALTPAILQGNISGIKCMFRGIYRIMRDIVFNIINDLSVIILISLGNACFITLFAVLGSVIGAQIGYTYPDIRLGPFRILPTIAGIVLGVGVSTALGGILALGFTVNKVLESIFSLGDLIYDNFLRRPYNFLKSFFIKSDDYQLLLQQYTTPNDSPIPVYQLQLNTSLQVNPKQERAPSKFINAKIEHTGDTEKITTTRQQVFDFRE